ncbi:MAG TPA: DUF350 domain-containing protein [Methanolinea sp.]|jgi:uncharacterized membrane protein YjfL (UPF0719 family)|nr:DUF350 domain-containing protein [Methanolinea sp.]HOS81877.1 DUF350 domain-containing protein [Methanolinea sp.]HPC55412.1 DUF350 domain-containing protein [Methanolinea sp.]HQE85496.1 DUF350 domain-containing protein [Methanolinea sp.]HQI14349.1 DUF350 domain-containing protein [Methanolinea sp.]
MLLANAVVGIIQLVIAIILAVIALYIGFSVLSRITKGIEEEKELAKGNAAVGIIVAAVFFAIALVVQSGVSGISLGVSKALSVGLFSMDGIVAIGVAILQLILGIVLAVGAIYLALSILDRLTKGVSEFEEIRKGNVAVALEMAGVIVATAVIIQSGVIGVTSALL